MPNKAKASKEKSQQLKKSSKRKIDDEVPLSEKEVRSTIKRSKNHPKHMSSEGFPTSLLPRLRFGFTLQYRQTNINLKQIKIASNKRKTWQPLSKSVRVHLQTMMETVIIAILSNTKEKEQIQNHLNCLKKRLLQVCETLKAPPQKLKFLTDVSSVLRIERAEARANEEGLTLLQEEIDKIVQTTESVTGNIQSLKNKIDILEHEIEEEEEKAKEMLQLDMHNTLSLPELSQRSLKTPTLQKETLMLIPNQNALLEDLDALHNSSHMKNMAAFIEEAYKKLNAP
ncbi:centromere protein Q isoform X1 [Octodon degus]|uniref:Centromere protein Q n=1 Tax=Octodon degus TaxID=10160 RepID=A0A6P6E112_OCTDE|nr:centromere protein Q isoform X1 [Octodon degus]